MADNPPAAILYTIAGNVITLDAAATALWGNAVNPLRAPLVAEIVRRAGILGAFASQATAVIQSNTGVTLQTVAATSLPKTA